MALLLFVFWGSFGNRRSGSGIRIGIGIGIGLVCGGCGGIIVDMRIPIWTGILLVGSLIGLASPALAAKESFVRLPLHVLSMYSPEIYRAWKEARIMKERCTGPQNFSENLHCPTELKRPARVWRLEVFEAPSRDSEHKGTLELRVTNKDGLTFRYLADGAKKWAKYEPSFRCPFFESDCVAEQSVLDAKGDWIQIPANPLNGPGWINFQKDLDAPPRLRPGVIAGRSYIAGRAMRATKTSTGQNQFLYRGEEFFVKKIEGPNLIVRHKVPGDEVCKPKKFELENEPPDYALHMSELYDAHGQLRFPPAYADYCPGFEKSEEKERNLKL